MNHATSISFRVHNLSRTHTLISCGFRHAIIFPLVVFAFPFFIRGHFVARINSEIQRVLEDIVQKTSKRAREINLKGFHFFNFGFWTPNFKKPERCFPGPFFRRLPRPCKSKKASLASETGQVRSNQGPVIKELCLVGTIYSSERAKTF